MLNFREYKLPVADYDALYDVPEDVKDILDIYDQVNGRSSVRRVERVNELLDEFVDQQCFVAEYFDEDETAIWAVANYRMNSKGQYGFIEGVAVTSENQGQGIGGFVINKLVQITAENNLPELRLRSVPSAVKFYLERDFIIIDGDEQKTHPVMSRLI